MSSSISLGCAQNPDGSLKEACEIEWARSRSGSPINFSAPGPGPSSLVTASGTLPNPNELQVRDPSHGKDRKKPIPGRKLKSIHPSRKLSTASAPTKQRKALTLHDKLKIIDFHEGEGKGLSQARLAEHFNNQYENLTQSSISRILKYKDQLRKTAQDNPARLAFIRNRKVKFPDVEEILWKWQLQQEGLNRIVSGRVLMQKAQLIAKELGIPPEQCLHFSNGWLDAYKQRHNIRATRYHGEAASVSPEAIAKGRAQVQAICKNYKLCDIYNFDETGLYYRMPPDKGLATKQMSGVKGDKTRLTLGCIANADGSDIRPPLIIGKAQRPHCFKKKDGSHYGFIYYWNKKAWMTGSIFQLFLTDLDNTMREQNRSILLLIDNASSHIFDENKLTNVRVVFLPPNTTSHLQPMDAGVIRAFKAHYRRLYIFRVLDHDLEGRDNIYFIDQLEGMNVAKEAWSFVTQRTIANCWKHAGILHPSQLELETVSSAAITSSPVPEVKEAESELRKALEEMVLTENVTPKNLLTIDELLDVEGEKVTEQEFTVEELIEQHKLDTREANGEHIEELDDPEPAFEPVMSMSEACTQISALERLAKEGGSEWDDARRFLPKLKRLVRKELNTKGLKQSGLRDYFM